jgi:hypothetical protein
MLLSSIAYFKYFLKSLIYQSTCSTLTFIGNQSEMALILLFDTKDIVVSKQLFEHDYLLSEYRLTNRKTTIKSFKCDIISSFIFVLNNVFYTSIDFNYVCEWLDTFAHDEPLHSWVSCFIYSFIGLVNLQL